MSSTVALKFSDPFTTAKGEERASVNLERLETLWFNTGTICNLKCRNCYIESSPTNDRLSFLEVSDVEKYLAEISEKKYPVKLIGLTGGEPFKNPDIMIILKLILEKGFELLILTNAFKAMKPYHEELDALRKEYGDRLKIRVSLDHYTADVHEKERGRGTFLPVLEEIKWLHEQGFAFSIAGRSLIEEEPSSTVSGYLNLLESIGIQDDLHASNRLVIFPEMSLSAEVPEITVDCWKILDKSPSEQMCATERMIVKRKGHNEPVVLPCTLLAYDKEFELGNSLEESFKPVQLNHVFCASFCVLGNASCSSSS